MRHCAALNETTPGAVSPSLPLIYRRATAHAESSDAASHRRRACVDRVYRAANFFRFARQFIEVAMHRIVLSTDNVPEAERFAYWREAIGERLLGTSAERNKRQDRPFNAHVSASIGASLARFRFRTDGYPVYRRARDIARVGWGDYICLYREFSAGVRFGDDRNEFVTEPGDVVVGDLTTPFASEPRDNYNSEIWLFPRKLFDPHLPVSQHPHSLILGRQYALSALVKAYLDAFAGQIDALDDKEMDLIADNFCRLLAAACGAGAQPEAARLARLAAARRYADLHLADPDLVPERAAAALKISVRQLHLLFEPSGESFARFVTRRRVEECRAALLDPIGGRSVTDIAFAWGFNNLSTFQRNFRQAFGATPSELRAESLSGRERSGAEGAVPQ
jgi:AraC-like DNA-binding protein